MEKYDYRQVVKDDIREYFHANSIRVTNSNREELYQELYDDLFVNDSITGNASGSYTFNAWKAEENLCHNYGLLAEACDALCTSANDILDSAEACDVTIRCYLLGECLAEVMNELVEDDEEEFDDEDIEE